MRVDGRDGTGEIEGSTRGPRGPKKYFFSEMDSIGVTALEIKECFVPQLLGKMPRRRILHDPTFLHQ